MRISLILLSFVTVFLAGCISPARRLEPSYVQRVQEGSTRREVEKLMGKPDSVVTGSNNAKVAHYNYVRRIESAEYFWYGNFASNPGDILLRHLSVLYNQDNVTDKVYFHQSLTPFRTGFAQASAGAIVHPESLQQIKKGGAKEKRLIELFGEPQCKSLDPDGNLVLEWYYAKAQLGWFRDRRNTQILEVTLDEAGWVKSHTLSGNVDP